MCTMADGEERLSNQPSSSETQHDGVDTRNRRVTA